MRRLGLLAGLIAVVFVGQGFVPAWALPPTGGATDPFPSQIEFRVCPNVTSGIPVDNPPYGLYTGATQRTDVSLPPVGCGSPVHSALFVSQGCGASPANSDLGTFPASSNPLGLYVGINTPVSTQPGCLGPAAGNLRKAPPYDILASFDRVSPFFHYSVAADAEGPNGALFQMGTFPPGTYTVSVFFQGGGPDKNGYYWIGGTTATGTVTVTAAVPKGCAENETGNHLKSHVCAAGGGGNHQD